MHFFSKMRPQLPRLALEEATRSVLNLFHLLGLIIKKKVLQRQRRTDGQTPCYRDVRTHLKMVLESAVQSTRNDSIYLETIVKMLFFFKKFLKNLVWGVLMHY